MGSFLRPLVVEENILNLQEQPPLKRVPKSKENNAKLMNGAHGSNTEKMGMLKTKKAFDFLTIPIGIPSIRIDPARHGVLFVNLPSSRNTLENAMQVNYHSFLEKKLVSKKKEADEKVKLEK